MFCTKRSPVTLAKFQMTPLLSFPIFSVSKMKEPICECLSEAKASHSHKTWTEVSSSVPYFLQMGLLLSPIIYRVSQEEWTKLRESVPYVALYRYNSKHLYPKLDGYGDNRLRKVWTSCISAYCTSTAVAHWPWQCNKSRHLCDCTRSARRDKTVLHYGQIFMRNVKCLVTLRKTMTWVRVFL